MSVLRPCYQCALPFGRGGVTREVDGKQLHFCCYGCSFTFTLTGEAGDAGTAGLFLARLGFAAFLSMNVMTLSWILYDQSWITFGFPEESVPYLEKLLFVLSVPVMLFVGYPFLRNAVRDAARGHLSIDSLIALGTFAAFGFSTAEVFRGGRGVYFDTATMTLVLVTAGRYIEAAAKVRSSHAVRELMALQPETARILDGTTETIVHPSAVSPGSMIRILPGERIPLDGVIVEGATSVNESLLTGESLPVHKDQGSSVLAATVNGEGAVTVRTTAPADASIHAGIVRLMEHAQLSRAPMQETVDRISAMFLPGVLVLAAGTFVGWWMAGSLEEALIHGLTVLVVACPCALGIGAPLAGAFAVATTAGKGILVRSTGVFERIARARHVVFDKTGTLTRAELSVDRVNMIGDGMELRALVGLERSSEHPIAMALVAYATHRGVDPLDTRNVKAIPGKGVTGEVCVGTAWIPAAAGNWELMKDAGCAGEPAASGKGTLLYIGWDGTCRGSVTLSDTLRAGSKDAVAMLHAQGMSTSLLSGDNETAVRDAGRLAGIDNVSFALTPRQKFDRIRELKTRGGTIMVGDGINDAPSLALADVGITLASGTDIAKESADVTIVGDHVELVPWLVAYARKTLRTINWNLGWAFGYNAVGIALAVAGVLEPVVAAIAMVGSSLFIIVNSRRLAA